MSEPLLWPLDLSDSNRLQSLRNLKHALIGNDKQAYFDRGVIEVVVPLLKSGELSEVYESLVILNSVLIDLPASVDVFSVYQTELRQRIEAILG